MFMNVVLCRGLARVVTRLFGIRAYVINTSILTTRLKVDPIALRVRTISYITTLLLYLLIRRLTCDSINVFPDCYGSRRRQQRTSTSLS